MQKKQITYSPLLGGTCEGIRKPPLISSAKKGTFLEQVPIVSVNRAKGSLFVCSLRSLPLPPISFAHLTHEPPNLTSHSGPTTSILKLPISPPLPVTSKGRRARGLFGSRLQPAIPGRQYPIILNLVSIARTLARPRFQLSDLTSGEQGKGGSCSCI